MNCRARKRLEELAASLYLQAICGTLFKTMRPRAINTGAAVRYPQGESNPCLQDENLIS